MTRAYKDIISWRKCKEVFRYNKTPVLSGVLYVHEAFTSLGSTYGVGGGVGGAGGQCQRRMAISRIVAGVGMTISIHLPVSTPATINRIQIVATHRITGEMVGAGLLVARGW